MTFLQLCQETRRECGIQGSGPTTVVAQTGLMQRLVDWVAEADMYICSLYHDWDFLWAQYTGTSSASSADLTDPKPTDLGAWDRESFAVDRGTATGRTLRDVPYKEWRSVVGLKSNQPISSVTIKPNGNLVLGAPADATYTVSADYWKARAKMTADADVPLIPTLYQRIIICRAKMLFYEDQQLLDLYKSAEKEFVEWLNKLEMNQLPGQYLRAQAEGIPMQVVPQ